MSGWTTESIGGGGGVLICLASFTWALASQPHCFQAVRQGLGFKWCRKPSIGIDPTLRAPCSERPSNLVPFLSPLVGRGRLGSPTKIYKKEKNKLVPTYSKLSNLEDLGVKSSVHIPREVQGSRATNQIQMDDYPTQCLTTHLGNVLTWASALGNVCSHFTCIIHCL